jgi:ferredoxin-thioredoxin reductase catalytic subunit
LYKRHDELVTEMQNRGYNHQSNLDKRLAKGKSIQADFVHTPAQQRKILKNKPCPCFV